MCTCWHVIIPAQWIPVADKAYRRSTREPEPKPQGNYWSRCSLFVHFSHFRLLVWNTARILTKLDRNMYPMSSIKLGHFRPIPKGWSGAEWHRSKIGIILENLLQNHSLDQRTKCICVSDPHECISSIQICNFNKIVIFFTCFWPVLRAPPVTYCDQAFSVIRQIIYIFNFFARTAEWILMKIGKDEVLEVSYKCYFFFCKIHPGGDPRLDEKR